jgi:hypothetical protein
MNYSEFKHLIKSLIFRIVVVSIFVAIGIFLSTNATVTNDVALNQLNGGDEAYLIQELYYKYKAIAPFVGTLLVIWAAYPPVKVIINKIKSVTETKENNNEEL